MTRKRKKVLTAMRFEPHVRKFILAAAKAAKLTQVDFVERCVLHSGTEVVKMSREDILVEIRKLSEGLAELADNPIPENASPDKPRGQNLRPVYPRP